MGQPKLLLPWQGTTVIDHVLRVWRSSRVERVVVVARRDDEALVQRIRDAALETAAAQGRSLAPIDLVLPSIEPPEMKDSIGAALRHLRDAYQLREDDAWLLAPADSPTLSVELIDRLLAAPPPARGAIRVPTALGKRSHPVQFPGSLAAEVEQLAGHEGVNVLLKRHPVEELELGAVARTPDFDTPDEYERLVERAGRR